jgi:FlaA1/EpsC-like NDP-sugar epimerase
MSLDKMWGGELFVPKIPSYNILDLAKAISTNAKFEEVGIRPGEKLHEEMITVTDAINTIEFQDYFVILPSTQIWDIEKLRKESNGKEGRFCRNEFSYNSGNNDKFLSVDELRELIHNNVDGAGIIYGD